ncbi:MAG: hypothetical protein PVG30_04540 [Gammaproteobacteria bacterium]|jgi:hypothetical protein
MLQSTSSNSSNNHIPSFLTLDDNHAHHTKDIFAIIIINSNIFSSPGTGSTLTEETLNIDRWLNFGTKKIGVKNAKKQIEDLREYMGFNISEIASIIQVKRPAIYDWLAGNSPNINNQNRLDEIYRICTIWMEKQIGKSGRTAYRKITEDKKCLMELLEESKLNIKQIIKIFDLIADLIKKTKNRQSFRDKLLKSENFEPITKEEQKARLEKISRKISKS